MESRLNTIVENVWHEQNVWRERYVTTERIEAAVYQTMEAFLITMIVFFFFFLYYSAFGFIVGSIEESNAESDALKKEKAPATRKVKA